MSKYQPKEFEKKWVEQWSKEKTYRTDSVKASSDHKKAYILDMFPYPSGAGLHVGHPRGYTATDILTRFRRMKGDHVLHPMGWDAFGLPAENAAIKAKKNPIDMVPLNIANFKRQMQMLGFSYDWEKEFATTDPSYYRFTQWLFIEFFKLGLLQKKLTPVYYCPKCKTGLAEEEVLPNGTHERCASPIERRNLPQWMFRITTYADSLLEGLKDLKWPTGILEMQKNWIGKDKGLNIDFKLSDSDKKLTVWTKYWETVFGVTFIVIAPEYPWMQQLIKEGKVSEDVKKYVHEALSKTDEQRMKEEKDKTGVATGLYAINPVNGKEVPIWVADYVLSNVGTGAVMGVPSHDERDFQFAKKYKLSLMQVVRYEVEKVNDQVSAGIKSREGEGELMNSGQFDGMEAWGEGKKKMAEWLIMKGYASWKINYHLRDWIFSRQRYWGEPIPMVHCEFCAQKGESWFTTKDGVSFNKTNQKISKYNKDIEKASLGWFPVDVKNLPLELPYLDSYEPSENGESPLEKVNDWIETTCPNCGNKAKRETDTMPNWAGSCWYFLYFSRDPKSIDSEKNVTIAIKKVFEQSKKMLPVDWYVGGAEHAVLHLLYARFWMHILNDMGLIGFREPFLRLRNVGMILAEDHHKMSKSLGNVINPDDVVAEFGADALRLYEMFMAPFSQEIAWSTTALQGCYRFLKRVWDLYQNIGSKDDDKELVSKLQKTVKKITDDIDEFKFNTSIAAMMEFLNAWEATQTSGVGTHGLGSGNAKKFLKLLAPFAPFTTEEIWRNVYKEKTSIHLSSWPIVDQQAVIAAKIVIPVQVNGKVRGTITLESLTEPEATVVKKATENEAINKFIGEKKHKVIYVKGKILSLILQ